jgi:hypothetical protein
VDQGSIPEAGAPALSIVAHGRLEQDDLPAARELAERLRTTGQRLTFMLAVQPELLRLGHAVEPMNVFVDPKPDKNGKLENPRYTDPVVYLEDYKHILNSDQDDAHRLRELDWLDARMNACAQALQSWFDHFFYCGTGAQSLASAMAARIENKLYGTEAKTQVAILGARVAELEKLAREVPRIDVLSREAQHAIAILIEMQERRAEVEQLVKLDHRDLERIERQVRWYAFGGTAVLAALVLAGWIFGFGWSSLALPDRMEAQSLPIVLVPWPIVVWSLIGGFAATLHRFNANPTHDFDDATRWLITRPLQGLLLGSTMYLVLRSGLLALSGMSTSEATFSNFVMIVACFLVAFSDRFAAKVFDALIRRRPTEEEEAIPTTRPSGSHAP